MSALGVLVVAVVPWALSHYGGTTVGSTAISSPGGHAGSVYALAVDPKGRWLVSGGEDSTVKVWETEKWTELRTLTGHGGAVRALAVDPQGRWLASADNGGKIKVWDTRTWAERHTLADDVFAFDAFGV